MLYVGLVNFVSVFVLQFATAMAGAGITKRIREQSYAAILRMEMAFFDKPENSPGRLSTVLSKSAQHISQICGGNLVTILQLTATVGVSLVWGFVENWRVAFVSGWCFVCEIVKF